MKDLSTENIGSDEKAKEDQTKWKVSCDDGVH